MLFGEKYGEQVRMITFDPEYSIELCGGCHVPSTGTIGYFKIISESAISAGVRRIEAITAEAAETYINDQFRELFSLRQELKNPSDPVKAIREMQNEIKELRKHLEEYELSKLADVKSDLLKRVETVNGIKAITAEVNVPDQKLLKNLIFQIGNELGQKTYLILGAKSDGKVQIMVYISEDLVKTNKLHAGNIIRELAKFINGGGGGQPFFASAGGSDPSGLDQALAKARSFIGN